MKQNGAVCLPGPALLFFVVRFQNLISGPKSYLDFRETDPKSCLYHADKTDKIDCLIVASGSKMALKTSSVVK